MRRLGLLGKGVLGQGGARPRYRWYAPAWAINGEGYAYANPTLGPELFTNGAFAADANWTKGAGWTIAGGVAVGSSVGASGALTQNVRVDLLPYVFTCDIPTHTGGVLRPTDSAAYGAGFTAPGAGQTATRFPSQTGLAGLIGNASAWSGTVDNLSAKLITQVAHAGLRAMNVRQVGIRIRATDINHSIQLYGWSDSYPLIEADNCVRITVTPATGQPFRIRLSKQVNGAFTTIVNLTSVTFVQDALLEIRRPSGNTFQLWYNGTQVGTDVTVSDASVINNTLFSMISLHPTTLISEFQINGVKVPFRF